MREEDGVVAEEQHRQWAAEMREKALDDLSRVEGELQGLREAIDRKEPLSLGRVKLLTKSLEGLREVQGAW